MDIGSKRLRQNSEYTHKFNTRAGRHGWLRLTPAYSMKIVEEIVEGSDDRDHVLDPFCGTGTTALCATNHGHFAATIDVNPFLVWFARAKTAHYAAEQLTEAVEAVKLVLEHTRRRDLEPVAEPPIHRIDRWWTREARLFLRYLKASIRHIAGETGPVSNLLHVAFCRTLIQLSNAAFNHQSMSFKSSPQYDFDLQLGFDSVYLNDFQFVLEGAKENPSGDATVVCGDARKLTDHLEGRFDIVISSPPYANRVSYIRELRPYMFWLGFLLNGRDAGELDWQAIGGTWGIATSRLSEWSPSGASWLPTSLSAILDNIAKEDNRSGVVLSNYVARYCEDMSRHFDELRNVLNSGARIHYIVGNSAFYGTVVPVEQIYATVLREYGFENVDVRAIRKRNSKKELVEFDVSATWPGNG